jgi:hypothetical protein
MQPHSSSVIVHSSGAETGHVCQPWPSFARSWLLGITHSAPLYREDKRVSLFSAQSAAGIYMRRLSVNREQFRAVDGRSASGSSGRDAQPFVLSAFRHVCKASKSFLDGRNDGGKQISSTLRGTWSKLGLCIAYTPISDRISVPQVQVRRRCFAVVPCASQPPGRYLSVRPRGRLRGIGD